MQYIEISTDISDLSLTLVQRWKSEDKICLPGRIWSALAESPERLDDTYNMNARREQSTRQIGHFPTVSSNASQCQWAGRPLRGEELAEFLAFDFKAGPIPQFHIGWLGDPVDVVLSSLPAPHRSPLSM